MNEDITAPVDRQLSAYNDHDVDRFVEPYDEDIRIYNFPDELLCEGRDVLREMYRGIFERAPRINARLVNRIVVQNKIIDEEFVTNRAGKADMRAVAIYEVTNGRITKVHFLKEG
jgi:hypothetical protein